MGLLKNSRVYLCGAVEAEDNPHNWRNIITPQLEKLGITVLNPLVKPGWMPKMDGHRQRDVRQQIERDNGVKFIDDKDIYVNDMTRKYCLSLVRMSDFIIAKINNDKFTVGTWEEISENIEKPILVISDNLLPSLWLLSQFNIRSIIEFDNTFMGTIDRCMNHINNIDTEATHPDCFKWIFLTYKST